MFKEMLMEHIDELYLEGMVSKPLFEAVSERLIEMSELSCYKFIHEKKDRNWMSLAV